MKIPLRTRLLLSYVFVISSTLILVSWLIETQIRLHIETFYEELQKFGPLPKLMEFRGYPVFMETVQNSLLLTAVGAGILAIVLSYLLTGYLTRPIHRVIRATKAISQGRYEARVMKESEDELGDLTESLNSMAEALQNHNYLQRQLITNVSHELATPLTNIGGYLEALTDNVISESKRKETYALLKEETDRLTAMLDEVRTLSMLQEPHFKIELVSVNAKALTEKILKQMQPQFDQKKVALHFKSTLKNDTFKLDKDRVTQVLLNLLNNALKYTPEGKSVTVSLSSENKKLCIEVADEGQGIPAKDLPFIFERFYRADPSRNRKTGGIGIGLAIVKELVTAHGGTIHVTSDEGKGTHFILTF